MEKLKKIAIFQQKERHTEILAFVLQNIPLNIQIHIYHPKNQLSYIKHYANIFNHQIIQKINTPINPIEYNQIILLTADEINHFPQEFITNNPHKFLLIAHQPFNHPLINKIPIIFLSNLINPTTNHLIALPIATLPISYPNISHTKILTIIGMSDFHSQRHKDTNDLIKLLQQYPPNIHINIITKENPVLQSKLSPFKSLLTFYNNIPATKVFDIIANTTFIVPLIKCNSKYHQYSLTGAFHLAINTATPMLLDKKTYDIYHPKGVLIYYNSITEIIQLIQSINQQEYLNLKKNMQQYRDDIIINNRSLFTENNTFLI